MFTFLGLSYKKHSVILLHFQLTGAPVIKCTGAFGLTYGDSSDPLYTYNSIIQVLDS